MFSRRVEHVSATKIFVGEEGDRQVLIYAMTVTTGEPLAMVLPLPVPPDGPDDAIELVNLEGYATLFGELARAFPDQGVYPQAASRHSNAAPAPLVVHHVGAFVASYVPHARDFARLDPRFRLAPSVLEALPHYADWGFAVFQLDKAKQLPIHPMALRFPRRDPDAIYVPLTHVHDGKLPAEAVFDHALYAQLPPLVAALTDWAPSHGPLGAYIDAARTHGLIDPARGGHAKALWGRGPNQDLWLRPPAGIALEDLAGEGPAYRYRINARYHFAAASHPSYPAWRTTSATRLPALCQGLRAGLAELTSRNARAWQLGGGFARPYFMNGDRLWAGTTYLDGHADPSPSGPGYVAFRPFSQSVEQQDIALAFASLPDEDTAREINRALCDLLERIARG